MKLLCPVCKQDLLISEKTCSCANGHNFDIAKEGYINLLLANKKNSSMPGDNKLMVDARENFLQKGFYDKLKDLLVELINKYKSLKCNILDVGCGTGYYSINIKKTRNILDNLIGIDISKFAVKKAAKKDKSSLFITGSSFDLPIDDNSCDVILNVFSPKANDEFKRVIKDDGILIEVMPGKDHMLELKQAMYNEVRLNRVEFEYEGFNLVESREIKYSMSLDKEEFMNQISMTPYFYKTNQQDIEKLDKIQQMNVTMNFVVAVWKKNNE